MGTWRFLFEAVMGEGLSPPLTVCLVLYFSQTFFSRTDPVGCSLKFVTFFTAGHITVEWAMGTTGTSSYINCCAFL
jgi:hypothetical protein